MKDKLADEALNKPSATEKQPASKQEQELGKKVAELILKWQEDQKKPRESRDDRLEHSNKMREIFEKLDPETAQKVVDHVRAT